jgi:four helix bundle suffix protein
VRAIGARLAGRLDLANLRDELGRLREDGVPEVRTAAEWALARMAPDGGRGGEIIARHGGYGDLKAYKAAEIAYDATAAFCDRFVDKRSRTHDQMVQAARSGKQNIVEASAAAGTSSKTELRLTGVARASLEELLADFRDFLRQRGLAQWAKEDSRAQEVRKIAYEENRSYGNYRSYIEEDSPETAANTAICLVCQATYLLDRLLKQLELRFVEQGGITERMSRARLRYRREQGE